MAVRTCVTEIVSDFRGLSHCEATAGLVSQNGIKLAVYLVSSYFGDIVSKVCECLLRKGTLPMAQIVRYTELSRESVKNSLLVLIQHNCVQAFAMPLEVGFGEAPRIMTQYMVLFDNIIHHMRFPKFLAIVSEELGKECEELFEGLLQHGRLSVNQISDRHKQTSNLGEGNSMDTLQENFYKLVNARFVERCPAHEPFLELPTEEEIAAKKRLAKSLKIAEGMGGVEQEALAAAAPMDSIRFSIETPADPNDIEPKSDNNSTNLNSGEKRKRGDSELDTPPKEVLWRANFEEFVRCLRHKACVARAKTQLEEAGIVLSAMLRATRRAQTRVKVENSVPLSIITIFEEVMKNEEGRSMTLERVRASLAELKCEIPGILIDETYSIDLKRLIDEAQKEEVESIVLKKYGREAYRIFRLLAKGKGKEKEKEEEKEVAFWETDKISDATFVEKKDTPKILYRLWKDDYVHMERVSANVGRQIQFSLWKLNKETLWKHVLDEMYHAALNLRLRNAYEQDNEKEIIQIPREKLVGEVGKRYKRLRKVRIVLESALMKLDDAILLFHHF